MFCYRYYTRMYTTLFNGDTLVSLIINFFSQKKSANKQASNRLKIFHRQQRHRPNHLIINKCFIIIIFYTFFSLSTFELFNFSIFLRLEFFHSFFELLLLKCALHNSEHAVACMQNQKTTVTHMYVYVVAAVYYGFLPYNVFRMSVFFLFSANNIRNKCHSISWLFVIFSFACRLIMI